LNVHPIKNITNGRKLHRFSPNYNLNTKLQSFGLDAFYDNEIDKALIYEDSRARLQRGKVLGTHFA